MDYPHDRAVWDRMVAKQVSLLEKIPDVSIDGHEYIDDPAPYRIYQHPGPSGGYGYSSPGYQLVQMTLDAPAIMDCRASNRQKTAHKLSSTREVRVSNKHTLQLMIPRTFNSEPIGWGIRFVSEPPMYPNIICATLDSNSVPNLIFTQVKHSPNMVPGMVCIGASQDRNNPVMPYVLISDLKNYLDLSDSARWQDYRHRGGVNDTGFEPILFNHMSQNYLLLRQAIEDYSSNSPDPLPNLRKKLGKKRPERRKLGK